MMDYIPAYKTIKILEECFCDFKFAIKFFNVTQKAQAVRVKGSNWVHKFKNDFEKILLRD